ncbi:hypothetical protein Mp_1g23290 [Marchantia polymorpha subsp. ruderalis]|uniref:Uncharacterized protein n=2 Tax=Marchantia polymorpha TaxID=3197 RepID=A0AAF6ATE7_MARPO|nr:hypothetical protein MARPO_0065s0049 [Marchantia polymorpha]BBM99717.1 hypothetical protein Mp_1g23290 [Marchantia polymorpha subsp. ruderalis]|eukprot:PTQ36239.1 hypothetical protein MARPO_0065s0049 [Marchantia polymorpha]
MESNSNRLHSNLRYFLCLGLTTEQSSRSCSPTESQPSDLGSDGVRRAEESTMVLAGADRVDAGAVNGKDSAQGKGLGREVSRWSVWHATFRPEHPVSYKARKGRLQAREGKGTGGEGRGEVV